MCAQCIAIGCRSCRGADAFALPAEIRRKSPFPPQFGAEALASVRFLGSNLVYRWNDVEVY